MRIRSCRFVLGCFAIVFWAQVVSAEQPADATYEDKITAVRQLIKSKNVDGAIAMLEVMFESRADDQLVVNLLRNCYEDTRNWGKAEPIQCMARVPLSSLGGVFDNSILASTNQNAAEPLGGGGVENGWFRMRGLFAFAGTEAPDRTPLVGVLLARTPVPFASMPYANAEDL